MKTRIPVDVPGLPERKNPFHKGNAGRIAVVAGSTGMAGAACLSACSALRSGAGLVYAIVPASLLSIVQIKLTEGVCRPVEDRGRGFFTAASGEDILSALSGCDVLALGPGMGRNPETRTVVNHVLEECGLPAVIDADGFVNMEKKTLRGRPGPSVLTPHPGELALWLDRDLSDIQSARKETAAKVAEEYACVVVLKGDRTVVAGNGTVYVNATGNPGMATAGSGDVLTGMIAALLGQGMNACDAAVLGVYLHGVAGDMAAEKKGQHSLIASDIVESLPEAFLATVPDDNCSRK